MTIMCLGVPFALLLPTTAQLQRADGRRVSPRRAPSLAAEFRVLRALAADPAVLALAPLMLYAQWFLSYQWQFNFAYFTVRSRALNSALYYLAGLVAAASLGRLLDWDRFSRPTRARAGFFVVVVTSGSSWVLGQVVQARYLRDPPTLDWATGNGFGLGCFVFFLWGVSDPL